MENPKLNSAFPSLRFLLITLLMLLLLPFLFAEFINWWPPKILERHSQREKVMERVRSAGGWDAIKKDCVVFAEKNTNGFYSHWRDTNGLTPVIIALKPMIVEYYPPYGCVRIRIFGIHATGGHSTPFFGLEVDVSTNSTGHKHGTGYENGGVIGNYHSTANQVAEGIYEIY